MQPHDSMIDDGPSEPLPVLELTCAARITFASAQNAVPILRSLVIRNDTSEVQSDLVLTMHAQPPFVKDKRWAIDRIAAESSATITDTALTLDLSFLDGLNEAERGQLSFKLELGAQVLADEVMPVEILARDEWGGVGEMAQILAAFVSPNDPSVPGILKDASRLLEEGGHRAALEGYQSGDSRRVYMMVAAIWSSVTGIGLTYAVPPQSFELQGQKVRDPGRIVRDGLATCLDISLLFAAALEACGLNSAVIFTREHAFVGVWLTDKTFTTAVEMDVIELRKAIAGHEFIPFETTLVTSRPPAGFDHAVASGKEHLSETVETEFERAVDIARARAAGIRPLASHRVAEMDVDRGGPATAAALPPIPSFDLLPGELTDESTPTPQGRIERWQRKLLDLSLRNRLLNFRDTQQTIPFVCPDISGLEDLLADGKRFKIVSLADENPVGDRDPQLYREQTGKDINDSFAATAMERGQVCVPLTGADMKRRLVLLNRRAKSDLSEGGTNTLFLAVGFLRWKKEPEDTRVYRAPLLLLPVKLSRRSAQSEFTLSHHEDDVRVNATLLQFLERDYELIIPGLQGDLPMDHSGIDLPRIFEIMRLAVRDIPGFEVSEDLALSTFSFAKYLMWKDLVDRTDSLRGNRLVKHLIDNPDRPFSSGQSDFPEPADVDRRHAPSDLLTPLPADSSQLSAVLAAASGHDFVIIGPPGTGKSQTIANMIAHCLAIGKTVLFVAEKSAALDVVYRRLKAYGLGDACLELHSNKSDRRSVLAQLGSAWERTTTRTAKKWVEVTSDLKVHRDQLNNYVRALHKEGSHGVSVFSAIGLVAGEEASFTLRFNSHEAHDAVSLAGLETLAERAGRTFDAVKACRSLGSVSIPEWSYAWQAEFLERSSQLEHATTALMKAAGALGRCLGLTSDPALPIVRLEVLSRFAIAMGKTAAGDFSIVRDPTFGGLTDCLDPLEAALRVVVNERARLTAEYSDAAIDGMPIEELEASWRQACAKFWPLSALAKRKVRILLQGHADSGTADPGTELAHLRALQGALKAVAESPLAVLPCFDGVSSEVDVLRTYLADATALRVAIADLDSYYSASGLLEGTLSPLLNAYGDREPGALAAQDFATARSAFDLACTAHEHHAGGMPEHESLQGLLASVADLLSEKSHLNDWAKWVAVREEASGRGLDPLLAALEQDQVGEAAHEFRVAYFLWWLPLALDASPELRGFVHWDHSDLVKKFRELDATAQDLAASQVRSAVAHGLPKRDGVPRKSELGFLRHQLGLQRPSASIRDLIGEVSGSFTKLAPCVLMSPLSVAQYLPTDHALFDIVIFDEASQITTWDAVGAIARGQQSIIVGDPKQLPPTNFFGRSTDEDDEDLELYEKDLPSILDEADAAGLPTHQLNWHYRSRDEGLIAFSNHHYYGHRLVTFPSPSTDSDAVVFHKVDGIYARGSGRTNEVEARAIADLAAWRLKEWLKLPEDQRLTLGIITFNAQQQELILDMLDSERRSTPALEWFFEDAREEPVIVKNLENIQGDERDVMLFSITFGPDLAGKMTMSFGAINNDGGEKRLNVAVTRARAELHVFASITADQIDLSRTKSRGVADLKNFLDYAARGAIALPAMDQGSLGPAENAFEAAIARALEGRGWEVRTQVGVSGFRIDLAVVHPDSAGAYLAGIECDGATYHSSASARDRDQIREGVLRNLGWEILRVWSTDWFMNPKDSMDRTDAGLRELLEASRSGANEDQGVSVALVEPEANAVYATSVSEEALVDAAEIVVAKPDESGLMGDESESHMPRVAALAECVPPVESTAGEPPAVADPARFQEPSYTETLVAMVSEIVRKEGPLTEKSLVRLVSKAHGWQRSGRVIRERVASCLGANEVHRDGDVSFVWYPGTHARRIPFRPGLQRDAREIPSAEIFGLIAEHSILLKSEDPCRDLAQLIGIGRLSEELREHLEACLAAYRRGDAAFPEFTSES